METLKHRGGCGCCPKSEDILAMDTELYYSFGGYAVRKDGNHYFREELDKEWGTNKTLSQIEEEAKLFPDSVWHIDLDLPLRGATWTRKED